MILFMQARINKNLQEYSLKILTRFSPDLVMIVCKQEFNKNL